MKLAYIVYESDGEYSFADVEHNSVLEYLQQKGFDAHKEAWADKAVDWEQYQCIILKSPWDYVEKMNQFKQWLDKIVSLNIQLLNPADIVLWNSDKHYLNDIAGAGLKVIETAFIEKGERFEPAKHFTSFNTGKLVVKPCISGASKNTFVITQDKMAAVETINSLLQHEAMMVQPFLSRINEEGEWSMIFFGGQFSHALVKTPADGDFRSQPQFGAVLSGRTPAPAVLKTAQEHVDKFAKGCLYARVDGLVIEGAFYLMELELIDPYLFLSVDEKGYQRYYEAVKRLV
ncbi:MAG: hypothetical protein WCF67_09105 [Chitinophagaceae bacterium]